MDLDISEADGSVGRFVLLPASSQSHTSDESHSWLAHTFGIALAFLAMPIRPSATRLPFFTQFEDCSSSYHHFDRMRSRTTTS